MNLTDIQERCLQALESGEFTQAFDRLVDEGSYCCLGVACYLDGLRPDDSDEFIDGWQPLEDGELSRRLSHKLGLHSPSGRLKSAASDDDNEYESLIQLNDAEWTFSQIAAYIRANPENVFTNSEQETE